MSFSQPLGVNTGNFELGSKSPGTPTSPTAVELRKSKVKAQFTLKQAWEKAEQQFAMDSDGKRLTQNIIGKDGVLQKWKAAYEVNDSEDQRRSERMSSILNNVLNGIELVGAFASQAASAAFPPAGMCFNAISFLIDAPRQIAKVYDGLKDLFQEVEQFLVKFRIYQRIDDRFGLDADLILNTNNLLISFVRICGLATKLLHPGKWTQVKTGFKVVLFRDDSGVPAELENFRRLAQYSNMLTNTVTLEHVLQSEGDTKQILGGVSTLIAANNDEKTKLVNKDRLQKIEEKLFKKALSSEERDYTAPQDDPLPNTLEALIGHAQYKEWDVQSGSTNPVLVIWGSPGSGKTRMVDAVKEHLDSIRQTAERDDPSTYVAAYSFTDRRPRTTGDKKKSGSTLSHALRVLALQVASQSTTYARDLYTRLHQQEKLDSETDLKKLWRALCLADFNVVRQSSLYILLDAIHQEPADERRELLELLAASARLQTPDRLKIRVLLTMTATEDVIDKMTNRGVLAISANDINKKLISSFVSNEMQQMEIYQDSDKATRRLKQEAMKKLTTAVDDINFNSIRQKLTSLREAIEDGLPREDAAQIFEENNDGQSKERGQAILLALEQSLNPHDAILLNSILMWLMASRWQNLDLPTLEAALRLEQAKLPIEPLAKKIRNKYSEALRCEADIVTLDWEVESYFKGSDDAANSFSRAGDQPLITLDISIRNASESAVKKFVWDLNESMTSGRFDFSLTKRAQVLHVDKLKTHLTATRLCFKLLNEGWTKDTKPMLSYALRDFSWHLYHLHLMQDLVSKQDRKMIGEGLVAFLNDPYLFEKQHEDHGDGAWLLDDDSVSAVRFWLQDDETVSQLPLKEQRWVRHAMDPDKGRLYFAYDQALSIGKRWLTDPRVDSSALYSWLYTYVYALANCDPVPEFGSDPEINAEQQASGDAEEANTTEQNDTTENAEENRAASGQLDAAVSNGEKSAHVSQGEETEVLHNSGSGSMETQTGKKTTQEASIVDGDTAVSNKQLQQTAEESIVNEIGDGTCSGHPKAERESSLPDTEEVSGVIRALNWLREQMEIPINPMYHLALGDTYYGIDEYEDALRHYQLAVEDDELRPYALNGIALYYNQLKQYAEVIEHATEFLAIFGRMADDDELDEFDTPYYVNYLRYWANVFEEQGHRNKAIDLHQKAFHHQPDDTWCWWINLKLHCLIDEEQEAALSLLESWLVDDEQFGGQSPAFSMLEMTDYNEFLDHLLPMVRNIKREDLRSRLLAVASEATLLAGKELSRDVHSRLCYFRGVACTLSSNPARQAEAIQHFERLMIATPPEGIFDGLTAALLRWASINITKHKFEKLHAILLAKPELTREEKYGMLRELQDYFDRTTKECSFLEHASGVSTAEGFIAAFCVLSGFHDEAQKLCRRDVSEALDILSDDDPQNDTVGISLLINIFNRLGDRVSVLTAVSLLDRNIIRRKLEAAAASETRAEVTSIEITHGERVEDGVWRSCDGCSKDMFTSDPEGMWWCQFCPDFDLCTDCKIKHENGTLRLELCNKTHVPYFIHGVHTWYTPDELAPGKVHVDWEYVEEDANKACSDDEKRARGGYSHTFSRKGGEIIDQSEWIDRLRRDWNLPKSDGNVGRAQQ